MYKIIKGEYSGLVGRVKMIKRSDTAMFYPAEVKHPTCIVVFKSDLIEIPDEPTNRKD